MSEDANDGMDHMDNLFDEAGPGSEDKGDAESGEEGEVDETEGQKQAVSLSSVMLPSYTHPGSLQYPGCSPWAGTIENFQITVPLFVDVTLRIISILKKTFFVLIEYLRTAIYFYLLGVKHREYARLLSFERCCRMQ